MYLGKKNKKFESQKNYVVLRTGNYYLAFVRLNFHVSDRFRDFFATFPRYSQEFCQFFLIFRDILRQFGQYFTYSAIFSAFFLKNGKSISRNMVSIFRGMENGGILEL